MIEIKLFGPLRDYDPDGTGRVQITSQGEISLEELRRLVCNQMISGRADLNAEKLKALLSISAVATEEEVLSEEAKIKSNMRLALLPPVCGG